MAKRSLLLVDGDTRSLRVLEVSLKKAGFTVTTASDGKAALEITEVSPPDLIISNTVLENVDGFELCKAVKANPSLVDTPFVFLTDQTEIEHKIRGLELGVDEYLIKPIYIKEILTRVRILLQKAERHSLEGRNKPNTRFTGKLSDMGVVDLIQTVEVAGKSGVSHFSAPSGEVASLYFRDGAVIDAELSTLSGAEAVYRLLTWSEGDFEVLFRAVRRRDVINLSPQALLMEGMRRLDEWGRLLEQLPRLTARFEVAYEELAERLAELPDELNQMLRLFDGHRTLMDVVDQTPHGDLESLELIAKLFFEGLVVESQRPLPTGETWPPPVADREAPIDLPPARVRKAQAAELEHDPGDEVYEDIEVGEGAEDTEVVAKEAETPPVASPGQRPPREKSLVDIAIGEVAPVYPALARSSASSAEPAAEPASTAGADSAADAAAGDADATADEGERPRLARMGTERREVAMIPGLVERVRHQGERDERPRTSSSQPPPVPARAHSSTPPPVPPRTRSSTPPPPPKARKHAEAAEPEPAPSQAAAAEPAPGSSSAADSAKPEPPPRLPRASRAPVLVVVPDPPDDDDAETDTAPTDAATDVVALDADAVIDDDSDDGDDSDDSDDEAELTGLETTPAVPLASVRRSGDSDGVPERVSDPKHPPVEADGAITPVVGAGALSSSSFDEFTPTPAVFEHRAPVSIASREPSSLRVISSDGAEIVAVAGAISTLDPSGRRKSTDPGSVVVEDQSLHDLDEPVEEPTIEEPLGQRARRSSPPPLPPLPDEKRSPLPIYFAVAATAVLLGLLFLLKRGPMDESQNNIAASSDADASTGIAPPPTIDAGAPRPTPVDASIVAPPIDAAPVVVPDAAPTPREVARDLERKANRAKARGQMREALGFINDAIAARPAARNMSMRADVLYALGRRREAIIAADAAIRMSSSSASAWRTKGLAHYEDKQYGEAKKALGRYLELRPTGESSDRIRTIHDRIDQ